MDEWDDIRYFLAVARSGSVTAAAVNLNVNHSTVSRRIQAFEKKHDIRLFERLPSGYKMTQSAENIYQYALEIEQKTQEIDRSFFGQDSRLEGRVNITATNMLINDLIMPHLPTFLEKYPGIDLEFHVTADIKNMAAREADIAIRLTPQPPEALVGRQVANLNQGVYTSQDYWLKNSNSKIHNVILWSNESVKPAWVQDHFPDAQVILRADTVFTMVAALKAGIGIAHMPCIVGDMRKQLFRLDVSLAPPAWGVWVLSHADLRSTERIRVCREFLFDILSQHKNQFEGKVSQYVDSFTD